MQMTPVKRGRTDDADFRRLFFETTEVHGRTQNNLKYIYSVSYLWSSVVSFFFFGKKKPDSLEPGLFIAL